MLFRLSVYRVKDPSLPVALGIVFSLALPHLNPFNKLLLCFLVFPIAYQHLPLFLLSAILPWVYHEKTLELLSKTIFFTTANSSIKEHIHFLYEKEVSHFFCTFFLGDDPHFFLQQTFQSVGLTHLLAISGFHFQALLSTFDLFVSKLAKGKIYFTMLVLIAIGYIGIVQLSPSVLRSFISIQVALLAPLFQRIHYPKNTLYFSFVILFFLMPERIASNGSALSFLATFGILHYFEPLQKFLEPICLTKSLYWEKEIQNNLKRFLLGIVVLNLAVMLPTIPFVFLKIGSYPPVSLIMNLFVPTLMIPSLFLFILSLIFPFLAPLNGWYTEKILLLLETVPRPLTSNWDCPEHFYPLIETILILTIAFPIIRSCVKTADPF
ncbi:MAG: ComEC/Rec2 family competence protein [Chlamydiia bacterium]